jgi:hypothetical protein
VYIVSVRFILKISTCTLAAGVLAVDARAIVPDSTPGHYQGITERNAFGLRPPPTQAPPTNPPAQLSKVTLTGITTILGNKRALMKVLPTVLKPGEAAKELSLILTEGQREDEIEVLQIDEKAGSVKLNNSGTVMTLTFEKDGAKLPATSVLGAVPNAPGPLPFAGAASNPYLPAVTARRFPGRNPRSPATAPAAPGMTGSAAAPAGGIPAPTGLVPGSAQATQPVDQEMTADEQAIVQAIQRQVSANSPNYPPLPSTALSPVAAQPVDTGTPGTGANLPVPTRPPVLVPQ